MALSFRIGRVVVGVALAGLAMPIAAQVFRPTLRFCNRTVSPVTVAMAYDLVNTGNQTTEGWFKVNACTCRVLMQNRPLRATEIFLMARNGGGGNILRGASPGLCVRSSAFSFLRENASPQACAAAGGQPGLFKYYQTNGRPHVVNLRRAGECNLMGDQ